MSAVPRLFVEADLSEGAEFTADEGQGKYLARVMRLKTGDAVRLFNGRDGDWTGVIARTEGKHVVLRAERQTRPQSALPPVNLSLLFAPLKKTQTDFVVEKATELGVKAIYPVITERAQTRTVRADRLSKIALEAAEQTERLDVPVVHEAQGLEATLSALPAETAIIFCDEAGDEAGAPWGGSSGRAGPLADLLPRIKGHPAAILIGPEGGFSPEERKTLRDREGVFAVSLGPRILRAETAAVAALTLWQALCGDWQA